MKRSEDLVTAGRSGRIMGLDVGEKTIGIALSDELGLTAQPYQTLKRCGEERDLQAIRRILEEREVASVVVGLPKNMDGSVGRQARRVLAFAEKISSVLCVPVEPWDERLSTVAAERVLIQADVSRAGRRKHVDKLAASVILQGYLDSGRAAAVASRPSQASDPDESG
jgi:putative Holliday junction resolvase